MNVSNRIEFPFASELKFKDVIFYTKRARKWNVRIEEGRCRKNFDRGNNPNEI